MSRKLQTIYEYFSDYSEQEVEDMIYSLSIEEKLLVIDRYGNDLHNPVKSENWSKDKTNQFYGTLVPKMKKLLAKGIKTQPPQTEPSGPIKQPEQEMTDNIPMLLHLIKQGKSNKEICESLDLNSYQLYDLLLNLKNRGMMISRKYYSDGSIKYKPITAMQDLKNNRSIGQDRTIITDASENTLKFLVISDLHFGNELESLYLIDRAYNYCIKNGIHTILCGGDLIDGAYTQGKQRISDLYKQIEYFIQKYPFDKSILTFSVAGDHDISAFNTSSLDIIEMCNNFRHDIIVGGYNNTGINLKNDQVLLFHHIEGGSLRQAQAPIILHGHSHKYTTSIKDDTLNITIPSLSGINQPMPTALELDLYFNNGFIVNSIIKQVYLGAQDVILGESTFSIQKNRTNSNEPIRNIENFKSVLDSDGSGKKLVKTTQPLTQIEKFNKRYGR